MKKYRLLLIVMIVTILICGCSQNKNGDNKAENKEKIINDIPKNKNDINTNQSDNIQQNNTDIPDVNQSQNIKEPSNPVTPTPIIPDDNYQTLTCSYYESDGDMSIRQKVIVKFRNDKVYNLNISINTSIINDEIKYLYSWEDIEKEFEEEFKDFTYGDGVDVSKQSNRDSYSYFIKIGFDLDNVSRSKLEKMGFEFLLDSTGSYDVIKSNYTIMGYTCG